MSLIQELSNQANLIRNRSEWYQIGDDRIEIKPLTVGDMISISPFLNQIVIDDEIKSPEDFFDKILNRIEEFMEPIKSIFSELIEYEFKKFIPVDLVNILLLIIKQLDTKSFQNSIILLRKISRNSREIIARAQKQEEQNYSTQ